MAFSRYRWWVSTEHPHRVDSFDGPFSTPAEGERFAATKYPPGSVYWLSRIRFLPFKDEAFRSFEADKLIEYWMEENESVVNPDFCPEDITFMQKEDLVRRLNKQFTLWRKKFAVFQPWGLDLMDPDFFTKNYTVPERPTPLPTEASP